MANSPLTSRKEAKMITSFQIGKSQIVHTASLHHASPCGHQSICNHSRSGAPARCRWPSSRSAISGQWLQRSHACIFLFNIDMLCVTPVFVLYQPTPGPGILQWAVMGCHGYVHARRDRTTAIRFRLICRTIVRASLSSTRGCLSCCTILDVLLCGHMSIDDELTLLAVFEIAIIQCIVTLSMVSGLCHPIPPSSKISSRASGSASSVISISSLDCGHWWVQVYMCYCAFSDAPARTSTTGAPASWTLRSSWTSCLSHQVRSHRHAQTTGSRSNIPSTMAICTPSQGLTAMQSRSLSA